jgi:hypothetical protein
VSVGGHENLVRGWRMGPEEYRFVRQYIGWQIQGILEKWTQAQKENEQSVMQDSGKEIMDRLERQLLEMVATERSERIREWSQFGQCVRFNRGFRASSGFTWICRLRRWE